METKALFAALVKAQAEMSGAKKDSSNPFFKSNYADLSSVMEAIRPALVAHGLGFIQIAHDAERAAVIETVIIHESGESYHCGKVSVPVSKIDAQGYGSAVTYAKRYSLQSAFGVPSVDDDGNAATKARIEPPKTKPTQAGAEPHSPAKLAFEMLDPETQDFLRSLAIEVTTLCGNEDFTGAVEHIKEKELDADQFAGLSHLLSAPHRRMLKVAAKESQT